MHIYGVVFLPQKLYCKYEFDAAETHCECNLIIKKKVLGLKVVRLRRSRSQKSPHHYTLTPHRLGLYQIYFLRHLLVAAILYPFECHDVFVAALPQDTMTGIDRLCTSAAALQRGPRLFCSSCTASQCDIYNTAQPYCIHFCGTLQMCIDGLWPSFC